MRRLALVVGLLAHAACDPPRAPRWQAAGAAAPVRGGALRIALKDSLTTLDPVIAYDEASFIALRFVFEPLLDYGPGSTALVPRLARRWEVSADGKRYTFWLRPDARYEDGTPIVAGDVAFALERALRTPDSPFAQWLSDIVGAQGAIAGDTGPIAGITTPSDHELVIDLAHPSAAFAYVFAMPFTAPQRRAYVTATGAALRRRPLASGPYRVAAWSEGERLALVRNDAYRGAFPGYPDEVTIFEAIARDTQFLMFEQGQLDSIDRLAAPDLLWLRAQPAWQPYIRTVALLDIHGARFDVTQKPFDDVRVRRAFSYALDRGHVTKLLAGTAVAAHGALPPGVMGRDDTMQPDPHDPARARALLAAAGYANGLTVEYVTIADEEAEKLAVSMQGDLAAVGVDMRIAVVSFAVYLASIGKRTAPAFSYAGWLAEAPDPTQFLDAKFHSAAAASDPAPNDTFYANPALDALLDAARVDVDPERRAARYREAEKILAADAPWLWSYHQTATEVTQPYVRDVQPHPVWGRDFAHAWLDLDAAGRRVPR